MIDPIHDDGVPDGDMPTLPAPPARPDFLVASAHISMNTPWVHHGRDERKGLDCIGLVMALYRHAGLPFDDLDIPYAKTDAMRMHRTQWIVDRLRKRFNDVGAKHPRDCRDGDVLLIGGERELVWDPKERRALARGPWNNHLGACLRGRRELVVMEMSVEGIRLHKLSTVWPNVRTVFRHHRIATPPRPAMGEADKEAALRRQHRRQQEEGGG